MSALLFSPIKLGKVEVKNRVALAPMGLGYYNAESLVMKETLGYVEARAKGGTGLIISQFGQASHYQTFPLMGAYNDRFVPGLMEYAGAAHKYGAKVFLQIANMGAADPFGGSYAPSAIDIPWFATMPKELTNDQILEIIEEFAQSALRAKKAGFDGVELHGGYGYLISEFMSPFANKRRDEYGGDFEGRMRVPVEIVRRIRRLCGEDFPVGFKFNAYEGVPGGVDPDLGVRMARRLIDEGVVYVHPVTMAASFGLLGLLQYPTMPCLYHSRDVTMPLVEYVKRGVGNVAVIAAGGIKDPAMAEGLLAAGKADIIALGRALLADPEWVIKAETGRRIRPCIRCMVCHYEGVANNKNIVCTVNPYLMREAEEPLKRADRPKRVLVVGGGPAGIMAAVVASKRGHRVTLCEKSSELGGLIVAGCRPPFKNDVRDLLGYLRAELGDTDVEVKLGQPVTPEMVRSFSPDALVVAIGAVSIVPPIRGLDSAKTLSAPEAMMHPERIGQRPLVIGGGVTGCEVALYLAQMGKDVTIVETLPELSPLEEVGYKYTTSVLARMVKDAGIKAITKSEVLSVTPSSALVRFGDLPKEVLADTIVLSVGMTVDQQQVELLRQCCSESYIAGDCVSPERIFEAIHEGDKVGRAI